MRRFEWLANTIKVNGFKVGAEIGCKEGKTTAHILSKCPWLKVYAVDLWSDEVTSPHYKGSDFQAMWKGFVKNTWDYADRLEVIIENTWTAAAHFDEGELDFVFIDADHSFHAVVYDIIFWQPKIRANGILCGHDINWPGVYAAVTNLIPHYRITKHDNVWWVRV
jgi:hypothetical protein